MTPLESTREAILSYDEDNRENLSDLLDRFAHELAQKQRAHANTLDSYSGLYDGDQLHSLPDLIDPQAQRTISKEDQT
ncbi:hypothetical protein [Streptomyces sp. NPDC005799]|uniref:hypothetical protein n=1 Tax=Streptomyces sp. NPDC005799 TaxID=3154678 RepID=UPI0033F14C1F